ncbi:MAG: glycosyltransferase family 4 protein [Flavobacteriales bacterium]|nr:glycosyltransferase family 4 protein [Flavobacteriales bacterium]
MSRLAIVVSHPIQYFSPMFRYLAERMDVVVFYAHDPSGHEVGREGFGLDFKWDTDLLSGYEHVFLKNVSAHPSLVKYNGCDTPDVKQMFLQHQVTHVLIFGWYLKSYLQALRAARQLKLPVAVRGDSQFGATRHPIKDTIKKMLYPWLIRKYSTTFYVGKLNREYLEAHGAKETQLAYAPHAVDQAFWHPDPLQKKESEVITFLWVGKMVDIKRPEDMVRAFLKASGKDPDIRCIMVGDGPLRKKCEQLSAGSDRISWVGFKNQTELLPLYQKTNCLVMTSLSETWGLVVNEAMACGIPAIVSELCGCVPDMIDGKGSGWTYPPGDVDALAQKISEATHACRHPGPGLADALGRVNKVHSFETNFEALRTFVEA